MFELVAEGTPVAAQTPGDCLVSVCDAKGVVVVVADPSDGPSDGDDCTADVCVGGVPEHPLEPAKSPCGQGYVCDGLGACVECVDAGQCASRVCVKGACLPPTCNDSVENGAETDVDCGGGCAPCGQGQSCKTGGDCTTSWCDAGVCQVATSCATLHAAEPLLPDGAYPIDPDGDPVSLGLGMPFPAYCDMTTDGGGFTLMATLRTTNAFQPKAKPGWAGAWSDDWFVNDHGDPTDPGASWVNRDARRFRPLVGPTTVLRASTPKGAVSRYHFGFTQADWDLWNASRTTANGINVIGVFDLANTLVSTSVALTNPKAAQVNGHFYNGTFYLGTAPNDADNDSEGLAARFHVGSNASPSFGYAGDVRGDVAWSLWLR